LNIKAAFENTIFESMCKAAEKHGLEQGVLRWIHTMLGSQQTVIAIMGCRLRVSVDQGCLQGGVVSPLLWSVVVDGLLAQLNTEGIYTQGYTNDLAMLVNGKFPCTVSRVHAKGSEQSTKLVQG
jgi:hypothetical protein